MIEAPHMLIIGSTEKACGKTTLACALIRKFGKQYPIVAVKVTPREPSHRMPFSGCELLEETTSNGIKDTQRMRAAGAQRAYWMRAAPDALATCADTLMKTINQGCLCICESNRLRTVIKPGVFLMLRGEDAECGKSSAKVVWHDADRVVTSTGSAFDLNLAEIGIVAGQWRLRDEAGRKVDLSNDIF